MITSTESLDDISISAKSNADIEVADRSFVEEVSGNSHRKFQDSKRTCCDNEKDGRETEDLELTQVTSNEAFSMSRIVNLASTASQDSRCDHLTNNYQNRNLTSNSNNEDVEIQRVVKDEVNANISLHDDLSSLSKTLEKKEENNEHQKKSKKKKTQPPVMYVSIVVDDGNMTNKDKFKFSPGVASEITSNSNDFYSAEMGRHSSRDAKHRTSYRYSDDCPIAVASEVVAGESRAISRNTRCIFLGLIAVLVIALVVVSVMHFTGGEDPAKENMSAGLEIQNDIFLRNILANFSDSDALIDENSVQHRAMQWLLRDDKAIISMANIERVKQRYIVVLLYFSFQGENWLTNFGFLSSSHECLWNGIDHNGGFNGIQRCNKENQITSIAIVNNNATGTIPSEIGELSELTELWLYKNNLASTIPASLGNLKALKRLALYSNKFRGPMPKSFTNLTNLQILSLGDNELSGKIPVSIGDMKELTTIHMHHNYLSGAIPRSIGKMKNLDQLSLFANYLSGTVPRNIFSLESLRGLWIGDNFLTGYFEPSSMKQLSNLVWLEAYDNYITGTLPPIFSELKFLRVALLNNNLINGHIPALVFKMSSLQSLSIGDNLLTGSIPSVVGDSMVLEKLYLEKNSLTGIIPSSIGSVLSLQEIDISENLLNGTVPETISQLSNLKGLWLEGNKISGSIEFFCVKRLSLLTDLEADCKLDVKCSCCSACS